MTTDRAGETGARFARWGLAQKAFKHRQRVQNNISHIILFKFIINFNAVVGSKKGNILTVSRRKVNRKTF